jgi:tetratricopeptide (TPR) repeat protein
MISFIEFGRISVNSLLKRALHLAAIVLLSNQVAAHADEQLLRGWNQQLQAGRQLILAQDYPGAEECFRRALDRARLSSDATIDDIAVCEEELAAVLQLQDLFEESTSYYKKAVHLLEKAHGKHSDKLVPVLLALGAVYDNDGDYKIAAKYYEWAASIAGEGPGANSISFADCEHRLGLLRFKQGDSREAERLYLLSANILLSQQSLPSSELLMQVLDDYVDLMGKQNEPGKILASEFNRELLRDRIGALPQTKAVPSSNWSKEVSARLARSNPPRSEEEKRIFPAGVLNSSGSSAAGSSAAGSSISPDRLIPDSVALEQINRQRVDFYERMIATDIDSLGAEHPSVARDLSGLAYVYLGQRQYEKAKPLLERALKIYQSNYGGDSLLVERTQSLLALISDGGNGSSSTNPGSVVNYVSTLPAIPLQARSLEAALRLNYLAFVNYCHGRIDTASKFYAWALSSISSATGEQSPLLATSLSDYGRVLRSSGQLANAEKVEADAYAILKQSMAKRAASLLP